MRGVAQLEGEMMKAAVRAACKIHRMVFGAATQEDEVFLDAVGDAEAKNVAEEFGRPFRVG
jgi:hypothetical protein